MAADHVGSQAVCFMTAVLRAIEVPQLHKESRKWVLTEDKEVCGNQLSSKQLSGRLAHMVKVA